MVVCERVEFPVVMFPVLLMHYGELSCCSPVVLL